MSLHELDIVTITAPADDPEGHVWPAGTSGTIVDLRDDAATIEIVDRTTGRTLGLIDAWRRDIAAMTDRAHAA